MYAIKIYVRAPLIILGALLAALLLWPTPAAAHASLVRSEPPAGAMLAETPEALTLEFSERLDPALSRVQLFDAGNRLVAESSSVEPDSPYTLRLPLGVLRDGAYTAIWRVRSTEDGHTTEGSVPFGIGVPAEAPVSLPPAGAPAPAEAPPDLAAVLGRWLTIAGLALVAGPLGFGRLIWHPVAAPGPSDTAVGATLRRQIIAGAILTAAGVGAELLAQAALAGGPGGTWAALGALVSGRTGLLLGVRLALAAAIVALALRLPPPAAGPTRPWDLGMLLALPLLLSLPLAGHAAASGALAIGAAWAHTLAMALWLGGLPGLLAALLAVHRQRGASVPLGALVRRFSILAIGAVAVLSLSGLCAAIIHLGDPQRLIDTSYGRALLLKLGIFLAILALGGLHLLVVQPRIGAGGPWAGRFQRTLAAEIGLGLALLLATAALTSSPPAGTAWAAQQQLGQRAAARSGPVDMVLWVAPGVTGDNLLALDVRDPRDGGPTEVLLRMQMPDMRMGILEEELAPAQDGRYQLRGSHLTMAGRWELEAIVRRPGLDDVRHTFNIEVRPPAGAPAPAPHQHTP